MDEPWILVVLLGLAIIVYAMIRSRSWRRNASRSELVKEMEDAFEQFAEELEADNRELMRHLSELKERYDTENRQLQQRIAGLEQELMQLKQMKSKEPQRVIISRYKKTVEHEPGREAVSAGGGAAAARPETEPDGDPARITERYQPIFQMYEQGKSIEYIAKKMLMNKGEIQLILKLAEQEEALRAKE